MWTNLEKKGDFMDFFNVAIKYMSSKKIMIYPEYSIGGFKDIMIKGQAFYAIWDEENNIWSQDRYRVVELIDKELKKKEEEIKSDKFGNQGIDIYTKYLKYSSTKAIDDFNHWCKEQTSDNFKWLNSSVVFSNSTTNRDTYSSIRLDYPLEPGDTSAWDELTDRLYSPEEKRKIEYAIGSIVSGGSKNLQKFFIFVGDAGTGKSTIMQIIRDMFPGYCSTIDVEALGNASAAFALEPLSENPLVAIQDDTDLSHIDTNVRLNSIVSHEPMLINEKHKKIYKAKFNTIIFAGSNREVYITDARSGLLRRIIDIEPTGQIFTASDYFRLIDSIKFEHGAIAWKCLQVYKENPRYYDKYYPIKMIRATNRLYNFVEECWVDFLDKNDGTTLSNAWNAYTRYCDLSDMKYRLDRLKFKIELKDYFSRYLPEARDDEGHHVRNYYSGFKFNKIGIINNSDEEPIKTWLKFSSVEKTYFDNDNNDLLAQYANDSGVPSCKWENCRTRLVNIDPTKLHYVLMPENHIVIDFDIKDPETGKKSFELNAKAAASWPPTYAELSKSGEGIHLHYIYNGDVNELSNNYDEDIEIKVFTGNASLRRKLTQCVNLPIATINAGLPKKEKGAKMVEEFVLKNEKAIRTMIDKNLRKEYHPGTKPSIDYIYKILEDAYEAGIQYDVTDLRPKILAFANNSSNHAEYCVKLVNDMKFMSDIDISNRDEVERGVYNPDSEMAFYDIEIFPNLFVFVYKLAGDGNECKILINPEGKVLQDVFSSYRMVGFNNRRYDNHICYARMQGYSLKELYDLSQKIINDSANCMFSNAYNLSYTDVYDFASSGNKKGLKKWEIELGISHVENELPWDQPVPEELWDQVARYCCNDVISTEIVFNHLQSDWIARQILADLSGLSVNDTTNQHTTKIIFSGNKHPQSVFQYRDLSKPVKWLPEDMKKFLWDRFPEMMKWWSENTDSLLPYFPGYSYDRGKSIYKGVEVGEGGYVEAIPGMYGMVALLDVASMHPHSMLTEFIFGPYTERLADLVDGRVDIKHEDWQMIHDAFDGKLDKYVEKALNGEITSKQLSNALKTAINSVYGLTAAKFENPFRDVRNKDNIVAKRGALFMVDLAEAVKAKGYTVAHIKTDSIKVPNMDQDIVDFVMEFGKRYGYTFEHEATYDKMCLVNDAVYIARYLNKDGTVGEWTATGAQFAEPYVFKSLFSHEDLEFSDFCQTKSVSSSLYLDYNEGLGEDEHNYVFVGKVGSFVPVKKGCGGADLCREKDGKYYSATGAKGYKWLEAETVKNNDMADDIDMSYFIKLADNAVAACQEYGSFEWLVDPAPCNYNLPFPGTTPGDDFMNIYEGDDDECPFEEDKVA